MPKKRYGSDVIVDVIKQYDIEYASINPGSSFRSLHDSLVNYGGNVKPEIIECPHENTAVGIAHGYAKVTGKPMLTILHNLVGLLHGTMAIYYAYVDRVPMSDRRSHRSHGHRKAAAAYRLDPHGFGAGQCHPGLCEMG